MNTSATMNSPAEMKSPRAGFSMIEVTISLLILGLVGLFVSKGFHNLQQVLAENHLKQQGMLIVGNSLEQARVAGITSAKPLEAILKREAKASARPELIPSCEARPDGLLIRVKTPKDRVVYELEMVP